MINMALPLTRAIWIHSVYLIMTKTVAAQNKFSYPCLACKNKQNRY
ncbi:hypothetical protein GLYMA_08G249650v4 [Glycine max]|nr:hypothetical protein GLYMA_08G249650v4 [Glycine max]